MAASRLRAYLRDVDENLYNRFRVAEDELRKLLEYSQGGSHITFTPHGLSHVSRLESIYDWLLGPDDLSSFNPVEAFILLLATYMHDLLMIPQRPGDEPAARLSHAENVANYLEKNRTVHVSAHEAQAIGDVVRGHHVDALSELPEIVVIGHSIVDIHKLAACLSMADICDADDRRAPRIVFDHLNLDKASAWHWRRHLQIAGITRRGTEIVMSAAFYSDEGDAAVRSYKETIEKQLSIVSPYFTSKLMAITRVDLKATRKQSQVDEPLSFKADVPALLRLLIDGVYQRDDVFIRELVQNSLDATYLAVGAALRRIQRYRPQIVVSELRGENDKISAIRVDDNGVGMSIREVRDSLLTIAGTQADSSDVKELLSLTGKNLIATFGIGLLSCLKISDAVDVRTKREGEPPVALSITDIEQEIRPRIGAEDAAGTTIVVRINPEARVGHTILDVLTHYCRLVQQADLHFARLSRSDFDTMDRRTILAKATEGDFELVEGSMPKHSRRVDISGEDYIGELSHTTLTGRQALITPVMGNLVILSDGILVTEDASADWLPDEFAIFSGYLNFAAGAVNLSASRDAVRRDEVFDQRRREISVRARAVVPYLAGSTRQRRRRWANPDSDIDVRLNDRPTSSYKEAAANDGVVLLLTMLRKMTTAGRPVGWVAREIDEYVVNMFDGTQSTLRELLERPDKVFYLTYSSASTVEYLELFNGIRLYYDPDVDTAFVGQMLSDDGHPVIHADNLGGSVKLNELELLRIYFEQAGRTVTDITKSRPSTILPRPRGLNAEARAALGQEVKFVHLPGSAERRSWRVRDELWINTANPQMADFYRSINRTEVEPAVLARAKFLILLLTCRFDQALELSIQEILDGQP